MMMKTVKDSGERDSNKITAGRPVIQKVEAVKNSVVRSDVLRRPGPPPAAPPPPSSLFHVHPPLSPPPLLPSPPPHQPPPPPFPSPSIIPCVSVALTFQQTS